MPRPPRMFDGSSSSKFFNTKKFHFFKVILPATIQQKRLGLPKKFIRKFGKELSEVAVLTVPNGKKWHVELKEVEGQICLENGWQEFVDYYSIGVGHFLVFGYDGSSCIHVLIFDTSATEIEYPCHIIDIDESNQENECQAPSKESESVESLDASPPCPIRAESVKGVCNESDRHQTSRMRHLKPKVKCEAPSVEASDSVEIVAVSPKCQKRKAPAKESESLESLNVSPPGSIRAESVKRVSNESDRHQTSTMRHLKPKGKCVAPSKEESDSVEIVDVSPIRQKRVDLKKEIIDESEGQQTYKMRRHTPRTRLRYSLRSFERKITRPTFDSPSRCNTQVKSSPKRDRNSTKNAETLSPCQVTQSTESDGYDSALPEESSDHVPVKRSSYSTMFLRRWPATTFMPRAARDFKSDNPFFLVIMRSSYVNEPFILNVPSDFAREHFEQDLYLTLLDSDERSFRVRCACVNYNARIYGGWRNLVEENRLEEGDVCVFELVNTLNVKMKVIIYRACRYSTMQAESVKGVSNERVRHQTSTMGHLKPNGKCHAPSPKRQKRTDLMKEVIDESELQQSSKVRRQTPKRDRNSTKNTEACFTGTQNTESDGCDPALQEDSSEPISSSSKSTMFSRRCLVTTLMTQVARDFKSDNPFCLVTMKSSFVNPPFTLNVPSSNFARKYITHGLFLTLRVSDGRSWRVRCHSLKHGTKISGGWCYFVRENHLKKGDVCVFELVNKHNINEMKVVIYRARS